MRTLSSSFIGLAVLLVSMPALADVSEPGCRCDSGSLVGAAITLPIVAMGVLFSRRGAR